MRESSPYAHALMELVHTATVTVGTDVICVAVFFRKGIMDCHHSYGPEWSLRARFVLVGNLLRMAWWQLFTRKD